MFFKEGKKILFSIPFLIFVVIMVVTFVSQYGNALTNVKEPPKQGMEEYTSYGMIETGDPEMIMQEAMGKLIQEYQANVYVHYPLSFYKEARLGDEDKAKMDKILEKLTGYTSEKLRGTVFKSLYYTVDEEGNFVQASSPGENLPLVSEQVSFEEFKQLMKEVEGLIGKGTNYDEESLLGYSARPKNYEEAKATYDKLKSDGMASGYARLFCDYLCLFAALMPVFVAVAEWLRDRGANMRALIWTRRSSSVKITFNRYLAIVVLCSAVIFVLAGIAAISLAVNCTEPDLNLWYFAYYPALWIIPSIMVSAAIGAFLTELTDTPIGILAMLVYWFIDINSNGLQIDACVPYALVPRQNTIFAAEKFEAAFPTFLINRIGFIIVSIVLMLLTALLLERKRRGRWIQFGKITLHSNKES